MIYIHFIVIALLLVSLLMGYRNQRWLYFLLAICMVVLFSFSVNIPDYSAYKYFYDNNDFERLLFVNDNNSSFIFSFYVLILKSLGFDYNGFRLFTILIICLISYSLLKDKIEIGPFICAYALIPFFFDVCQVRFFLSETLCFWAIYALAYNKRVVFLILVGLATYIHSMNVLCLLVYFVPLNIEWNSQKLKKSFAAIGVFVFLLFISAPLISILQNIVGTLSFFGEYNDYMERTTRYGYLLYVGYQIINVLSAIYLLYVFLQTPVNDLWRKKIVTLNYFIQIFGILFIILIMLNVNFSRYFRMFFALNALAFGAVIVSRDQYGLINRTKIDYLSNKVMNVILYSLMIGTWLFAEIMRNGSYVIILKAINQNFPSFF